MRQVERIVQHMAISMRSAHALHQQQMQPHTIKHTLCVAYIPKHYVRISCDVREMPLNTLHTTVQAHSARVTFV